jgi:predicted nucleic acid-binding protein
MYLLDTSVISELRKAGSGRANASVVRCADSVATGALYISAISVLELELGVLQIEQKDAEQGALLRAWLDRQVMPAFEGRILPVDAAIAKRCAALHVPDPRVERDALIAATALVHGMTIVTRNSSDFGYVGLALIDPWQDPTA